MVKGRAASNSRAGSRKCVPGVGRERSSKLDGFHSDHIYLCHPTSTMAATKGSWFSNSILRSHAATLPTQQKDAVRNDPNTVISFYEKIPIEDISLPQFEEWAIARLRVLKGIEFFKSQNRKEVEFHSCVSKLLEKHMKVPDDPAATLLLDRCSHFILRLAFCCTEEHRRWLAAQECDLFRHRYGSLHAPEKAEFLKARNLPYEKASEDDVRAYKTQLSQVLLHVGKSRHAETSEPVPLEDLISMDFHRVPFDQVPDLVATRKVFLMKGVAYVPSEMLSSVVSGLFRQHISKCLVLTAGRRATAGDGQESDRLAPILTSLTTRYITHEVSGAAHQAGSGPQVTLSQIPALAQKQFPLCMQHLYGSLMSDHHLRHAGRMQLGLFLKGAGLTMEESLLFWRQAFAARTSGDRFEKEYSYNVRHSYGKEGSRKDYEPHNCRKVILGGNPGVGEAHGCPFKTLDAAALRASMSRAGVPDEAASAALDKAKDGHYQIACECVFEGLFGEKPNEAVTHPNRYLTDALETQQRSQYAGAVTPVEGGAVQVTQGGSSAGTPNAMTSPGLLSPGTAMSLQQQQSFMRTPINVTPKLGGDMVQTMHTPAQQEAGTPPPAIAGSPVAGLHKSA
eukprot:jgi/Ulvmu1/9900/UM057_0057.1